MCFLFFLGDGFVVFDIWLVRNVDVYPTSTVATGGHPSVKAL